MPTARLPPALLVLCFLFATSLGAHAAESPLMTMFDTNHDNRVSLAEYQTYMGKGFRRMDTNGDGVLDATEMPSSARPRKPLTQARHRHQVAAQFHRQDTNHDGYLGLRELMAPPR